MKDLRFAEKYEGWEVGFYKMEKGELVSLDTFNVPGKSKKG